jgi:hypothetical protein
MCDAARDALANIEAAKADLATMPNVDDDDIVEYLDAAE